MFPDPFVYSLESVEAVPQVLVVGVASLLVAP